MVRLGCFILSVLKRIAECNFGFEIMLEEVKGTENKDTATKMGNLGAFDGDIGTQHGVDGGDRF